MRPKTGTLTPGFSSSRQREQGQNTCPWRFREKGWGRGDSGSAPDVPREPGPDVPSTRGGGEWGLDGILINYVLPTMFILVLMWKYAKSRMVSAVIPLITASEVSERIATVIRNIITTIFEIAQPVLTALGIGQILVGLLLALGLRQEFLGWRLIVGGLLTLIFTYVIAPLLLQFI
jgi:hypothetical protein